MPILLLVLPFLDHRSRDPVVFTYGLGYLVFLGIVVLAGGALAVSLAWLVRRTPSRLQLPLALFLLSIMVGLVLIGELLLSYAGRDAFAWYRSWGHVRSPLLGYEAASNHRWERAGAVYTTDANTFRTHPTPRVRREEETLIVVLGGSAVFGYGLNDDETWPHRLEQQLRGRFGNQATVLNAGCNGHNTLQQLIRFYLRVLPLKPDFLIHYGAINDVRTDEDVDQLILMPPELVRAFSARDHLRLSNKDKGFYFQNSLLIDRLSSFVGGDIAQAGGNHQPSVQETLGLNDEDFRRTGAMYIQNLDTIRLLCERNGITFVPVTFIAEVDLLPAPYRVGLDYYVSCLRKYSEDHGIPLIDLIPDIKRVEDRSPLFAEDHYHPSRAGAEFIASRVADAVTPMFGVRLTVADGNP